MLFLPRPYSLQFPPDRKKFPIVKQTFPLIQKNFSTLFQHFLCKNFCVSNSTSKIPLNVKLLCLITLHEEKCVIECEGKMRGIQDVKDVV